MPPASGPVDLLTPLGRRGAARLVDLLVGGAVGLILATAAVPADRPVGRLLVLALVVAAYETMGAAAATPGKRIARIRLLELDREGVSGGAALRRGIAVGIGSAGVAGLGITVLADGMDAPIRVLLLAAQGTAAAVWIVGTVLADLHRGLADRWAHTAVVHQDAHGVLTAAEVVLLDPPDPEAMTPWGPSVLGRARIAARFSRLDDAPLLLLLLAGMALSFSVVTGSGARWWQAAVAGLWVVAFVLDETWRVARTGATAGHRRLGAVVVDLRTGEPPRPLRSLARASVLGVACYTPLIQILGIPLLSIWLRLSASNRGLHDLIAGTAVVEAP